jgi:hypothetical protein
LLELFVGIQFTITEVLSPFRILRPLDQLIHPFSLNLHRIFTKEVNLMDPFFNEPSENGIKRHSEYEFKINKKSRSNWNGCT